VSEAQDKLDVLEGEAQIQARRLAIQATLIGQMGKSQVNSCPSCAVDLSLEIDENGRIHVWHAV
jgi:hypothetical protein